MKLIHNLITTDESGNFSTVKILKDKDVTQIDVRTSCAPDYFTKVSLDGNSNVIVEVKDGNGHHKHHLPNGAIWDILAAFQVLDIVTPGKLEKLKVYEAK